MKSYDLFSFTTNSELGSLHAPKIPQRELNETASLPWPYPHTRTAHSPWDAAEHSIARPHLRQANFQSPECGAPQTPLGCSDSIGMPLMARERNVNSVLHMPIQGRADGSTRSAAAV